MYVDISGSKKINAVCQCSNHIFRECLYIYLSFQFIAFPFFMTWVIFSYIKMISNFSFFTTGPQIYNPLSIHFGSLE